MKKSGVRSQESEEKGRGAPLVRAAALSVAFSLFTFDPASAHDGRPHEVGDLIYTWGLDPLVVGGLALSGWLYARGVRRLWRGAGRGGGIRRWEAWAYACGWFALFVALA